jgi:hypothetical protein
MTQSGYELKGQKDWPSVLRFWRNVLRGRATSSGRDWPPARSRCRRLDSWHIGFLDCGPTRRKSNLISRPDLHFDRKSMIKAVVTPGFSSMIQWPEPGTIPIVTLVATKRSVAASAVPNDFSAPKASTGIDSLPP